MLNDKIKKIIKIWKKNKKITWVNHGYPTEPATFGLWDRITSKKANKFYFMTSTFNQLNIK